jgi:hypothetical protein
LTGGTEEKSCKTSLRIASVPAKNPTQYLPNTLYDTMEIKMKELMLIIFQHK